MCSTTAVYCSSILLCKKIEAVFGGELPLALSTEKATKGKLLLRGFLIENQRPFPDMLIVTCTV
jgi:hypothetical protein